MKLCKDCKHFNAANRYCQHPNLLVTDPVTGDTRYPYGKATEAAAEVQRAYSKFEILILRVKACGKEGHWFERKNEIF